MADFPVRPEKEEALRKKMARLGIREQDLIEKFIKSGGKGGQKVNKASTCVYLKHLPTGIEVKCSLERSQAINRFLARRILADRIETRVLGEESAEQQRAEKIRRQKRRRSRRAKLKMLEAKRRRSEKKKVRMLRWR
ncbi:MAG: peptide chain release factor-like protein [Clostridiales bacterium]|jgi:protein subunit release factor B|nr:peptide chain release factor-like protein [Clostridiales bacterium]